MKTLDEGSVDEDNTRLFAYSSALGILTLVTSAVGAECENDI